MVQDLENTRPNQEELKHLKGVTSTMEIEAIIIVMVNFMGQFDWAKGDPDS